MTRDPEPANTDAPRPADKPEPADMLRDFLRCAPRGDKLADVLDGKGFEVGACLVLSVASLRSYCAHRGHLLSHRALTAALRGAGGAPLSTTGSQKRHLRAWSVPVLRPDPDGKFLPRSTLEEGEAT